MELLLSSDQMDFKRYCRDFARDHLEPLAEKHGETDQVPRDMVARMAEAGFFNLLAPEDLGGRGIKAVPICLAREAFAGVYCPADVTLAMQGLGGYPIYLGGNREQREKFLVKIGRGELLTTFALTEPQAGSDVNGMESTAQAVDGGWRLNGEKVFISNGYSADILVTFVRSPLPDNPRAMSAFILKKGMPGLQVAERLEAVAPHDLVRLKYQELFVPRENLLGEVGQG